MTQATAKSDAELGASDCESLDFVEARFEDCKFHHCDLHERDLRGARFVDCTFSACDIAVARVTDCSFVRVRFQECRLSGINWSVAQKLGAISFDRCQLNDGSFLGLHLERCEFIHCVARGTSFRDANLARASFRQSNLSMTEFVNCDLRGADFRGALDYALSPVDNRLDEARFSLPEAISLLKGLGVIVE